MKLEIVCVFSNHQNHYRHPQHYDNVHPEITIKRKATRQQDISTIEFLQLHSSQKKSVVLSLHFFLVWVDYRLPGRIQTV